jgi:hypothetical protein
MSWQMNFCATEWCVELRDDDRVRERLLRVEKLTPKIATDTCKIAELNADQLKALGQLTEF